MSYIEATLKTELVEALRGAGCKADKFPDLARGVKKPFDIVACVEGAYVAIETKLKKIGTPDRAVAWSDSLVLVKESDVTLLQHEALRKTVEAGGDAFVIAGLYDCCRNQRAAFALRYNDFTKRHVWTLADLRAEACGLYWVRGDGWDLTELLDEIEI